LSEAATHLSEAATHLSEAATHLSEAATHLSEAATHLSEAATHPSEAATHLSEAATDLSGPPAALPIPNTKALDGPYAGRDVATPRQFVRGGRLPAPLLCYHKTPFFVKAGAQHAVPLLDRRGVFGIK